MLCYYQLSRDPGKEGVASRDGESIPVNMLNEKKGKKRKGINRGK